MNRTNGRPALFALMLTFALGACGGGSDGPDGVTLADGSGAVESPPIDGGTTDDTTDDTTVPEGPADDADGDTGSDDDTSDDPIVAEGPVLDGGVAGGGGTEQPTPTPVPVATYSVRDLSASVYSPTALELFWKGDANSYEVRRDGVLLGITGGRSWFEEGLEPGTYDYSVTALDTDGGAVGSEQISVSTTETNPPPSVAGNRSPSAPANLVAVQPLVTTGSNESSVRLQWDASADPDGTVAEYEIRRDGRVLGRTASLSFTDSDAIVSGARFAYGVVAIDDGGARSTVASIGVEIEREAVPVGESNVPPTAPLNVSAMPDINGFVTLGWEASSDADGSVVEYIVRREGRGEIARTEMLNHVDEPPQRDVTYRYTVEAVDDDGAASEPTSATATLPSSRCVGDVSIAGFDLVGPGEQVRPLFTRPLAGTVGVDRVNAPVNADAFAEDLDITVDASNCTKSVNFVTESGFQLGTSNNRPFSIGEAVNGRTGGRWADWRLRVEQGAIRVTAIPWPERNTGGEFGTRASVRIPVGDPCTPDTGTVGTRYLAAKYADAIGGAQARLAPETDNICDTTPYYLTVDPGTERSTLDDWLKLHGFVAPDAPVTTGAIDRGLLTERDVLNTEHANIYDLGFGRDIYCVADSFTLPCLIQNYRISDDTSPDFLTVPGTFGPQYQLSVAMERQEDATAFFAFDKGGRRIHSVDLDGNGFKSIPEACLGCHDGEWSDAGPGSRPVRGDYLPLDFATFRHFSRESSYRYDPGRPPFYSNNTSSNRPINLLIRGLADSGLPFDSHRNIAREIDEFGRVARLTALQRTTPTLGTAGHAAGSDQSVFFARFCRSCHVSQQGRTAMSPTEPDAVPGFNCLLCHTGPLGGGGIQNLTPLRNSLCRARNPDHVMPNARVTHEALINAVNGVSPYSNSTFRETFEFVVDRACNPFANPASGGIVVTDTNPDPVPLQRRQ